METTQMPTPQSLFNRIRMGYAIVESARTRDWQALLGHALGMDMNPRSDGWLLGRMDKRQARIIVTPGSAEDLCALGLEIADDHALATVLSRLDRKGIKVSEGSGSAAVQRGVARFWTFVGPKGLRIELFRHAHHPSEPPRLGVSGFVTGDKGFGHVAITTRRPEAMSAFWRDTFDVRHSDDVHCRIDGVPLRFEFLRFNARHHSIALAYSHGLRLDPIRTRIQHLEVQVASLDDMSDAYARCRKLGLPISMAVGQHANDKAVSFYVKTPSGFDLECGWNPLDVDEATWMPAIWNRISRWGHHPEDQTMGQRIAQLARGVASLFRTEFQPPGS